MDNEKMLSAFISELRYLLDSHENQLKCYCRMAPQMESWFKAEIYYLLYTNKQKLGLTDFDREVKHPAVNGKIDFRLTYGSQITPKMFSLN